MPRQPHRDVYTVIPARTDGQRDFWLRIGASWLNRDGSETVTLNAMPLDGKLVLRDPRPSNEHSDDDFPPQA